MSPVDPVVEDARVRAFRSFAWGLLVDVSTAVVLVLATAFTDIRWTREYWTVLGLMIAKSVLQAVVAFFMRKLVPPTRVT